MKKWILVCGVTFIAATSASAQVAPVDGLDTLQKAGVSARLVGVEGLSDALNNGDIAAQRAILARNEAALRLVRLALRQNIEKPAPAGFKLADLSALGDVRDLGRLLRAESEVRLADGDAMGALDSRLTGLEMGAEFSRNASFLNTLTTSAVDNLMFDGIGSVALGLDAAQLRAGATRLRTISANRSTYADLLRAESQGDKQMLIEIVRVMTPEDRALLDTPEGRAKQNLTEAQATEIASLTAEKIEARYAQILRDALADAAKPYQSAKDKDWLGESQSWVDSSVSFAFAPQSRERFESAQVQIELIAAALELHAIRLETGAYPATFNAGTDPFSPDLAPLIYRSTGDNYNLFSVGDDGVADEFGGDDIVAPIF